MKTKLLLSLLGLWLGVQLASAQPTAFSFQGRLSEGGGAANGPYDFQFQLLGSSNSGPTLTAALTITNTPVSNGLFNVTLDFGAAPFNGQNVWLNIAVRNGTYPPFPIPLPSYTNLAPRLKLGGTYAIYAYSASNATTALTAGTATTANSVAANSVGNSALQNSSVTAGKIASNTVVRTLNGLREAVSVVGGSNVTVTTTGSNTIVVAAGSGPNAWLLPGNAGTTAGVNFLGTTDNQPLELKVNNTRALRLEPAPGTPSLIGGSSNNAVTAGIVGATIGGGGVAGFPNRVTDTYGAIGGGLGNSVLKNDAFIGGGIGNNVSGDRAAITGGRDNSIQTNASNSAVGGGRNNIVLIGARGAVIAGGEFNIAGTTHSTVGGGSNNVASAAYATVSGGWSNRASGAFSVVAGGGGSVASGYASFIGGGGDNLQAQPVNLAGGPSSAIVGGWQQVANGANSFIGGGANNQALGQYSTVPGGRYNVATADKTFAAGWRAKVNHIGAWVWANSLDADFSSTAANEFSIQSSGGVRIDDSTSMRFGATRRQMLNLHNADFGFGVQDFTLYARGNGFAWYNGGVHSNNQNDPGAGGTALMTLLPSGNLGIGTVSPQAKLDVAGTVKMGGLQLGGSATLGSVLTSDNAGNGAWSAELRALRAERITGVFPNRRFTLSANLMGGSSYNAVNNGIIGATLLGGGSASGNPDTIFPPTVLSNYAGADFASVLGGRANAAAGVYSTVSGGLSNVAAGQYSFAAGQRAKANHQGSFVWADSQAANFASTANDQFVVRADGGVGIGTGSPGAMLTVSSRGGDSFPQLQIDQPSGSEYARLRFTPTGEYGNRWDFGALKDLFVIYSGGNLNREAARFDNSGATIGGLRLQVAGLGNEQAYIGGDGTGDVEVGSENSSVTTVTLWNRARNDHLDFYAKNASVCTLTIRGGCDLAEPFQMSSPDIPKGSLMVIDEENPGKLKLAEQAYDTRVAGIISGANGVNSGITLHQEGIIEGGQNVALSGRVYALADAANGPIKPGDMLTSSGTPGHVMKVSDHAKAQGAIVGKAMSALREGTGMVLVLVTLQ